MSCERQKGRDPPPPVWRRTAFLTCVDAAVLRVGRHAADDHAPSLHRLLVEALHQFVTFAVDPRRPQGARVQLLTSFDLQQRGGVGAEPEYQESDWTNQAEPEKAVR